MTRDRCTDEPLAVRLALAARVDDCWDRLDDAATELHALHAVPDAEIVDRVRAAIAEDRPEPCQ